MLEQAAEQIRGIKVNPAFQVSAMELWKKMMEPNDADQEAVQHVQRAVQALAGDRRVALLVLQPPD